MSLMDTIVKANTANLKNEAREEWKQEVWELFRKHRGAFGPIVEKEVEAAFFVALATGAEYGGHLEFVRLTSKRGVTFGPPPWKVEDAFEVWLRRKFPGVRNPGGALVLGLEDEVKSGFLAGAEYGAAGGSEGGDSENRTGEVSGGSASPVATSEFSYAKMSGRFDESRPLGDYTFPLTNDLRTGNESTPAIPSREEWKLERCRTLVFAILGGLAGQKPTPTTTVTDVDHENSSVTFDMSFDPDPVGDYINELRELWQTM